MCAPTRGTARPSAGAGVICVDFSYVSRNVRNLFNLDGLMCRNKKEIEMNTTSLSPATLLVQELAASPSAIKPSEHVNLHDGSRVSAVFYARIRKAMATGLKAVRPGDAVTVKRICGKAFWLQLGDGDCRTAGICVATMVEAGELPLTFTGRNTSNSCVYRVD